MRPDGHTKYDFAENNFTLRLVRDGQKQRKGKNQVAAIMIGFTGDRTAELTDLLKSDWLCGTALEEVIRRR